MRGCNRSGFTKMHCDIIDWSLTQGSLRCAVALIFCLLSRRFSLAFLYVLAHFQLFFGSFAGSFCGSFSARNTTQPEDMGGIRQRMSDGERSIDRVKGVLLRAISALHFSGRFQAVSGPLQVYFWPEKEVFWCREDAEPWLDERWRCEYVTE